MGSIKKKIGIAVSAVGLCIVAATFVSVVSANSTDKVEIRLAHNQAAGSEIADSIAKFSEFVAEDDSMNLDVNIYASGVLGSEKEEIEMVQAGILDMAKVSSNTLGQFEDRYSIFAVPYLFVDQDHYYTAMEKSQAVKDLFMSTEDQGYIAIGYYAMGGSPVPMAGSETYTALQQGIVDGAENTELALTVDAHEDLVSSYTYTEHQYSPDIYIISTKKWNSLTKEQQDYLVECLEKTNENFKKLYNGMMDEAMEEAEEHGVHVYRDIDKSAFIEAVQPIHEEFCGKGEDYQALYDDIQSYAE